MSKSFAWSYSRLNDFETCPRRHYLVAIAREVFEAPSDEMTWGNKVHKALELRIKDKTPLPETLSTYEPLCATVEARGVGGVVEAEGKLALNADYEPCTYFATDCWVRSITDFTIVKKAVAFVGDWKTGKETPASTQLALCAGMTFAHKPYLTKVITSFVWLKTGRTTNKVFTREQIPEIWQEFLPRVRRFESAIESGTFPPKPSGLCRAHCPVPRSKCEHSGKAG